jgi:hypothetical protein
VAAHPGAHSAAAVAGAARAVSAWDWLRPGKSNGRPPDKPKRPKTPKRPPKSKPETGR